MLKVRGNETWEDEIRLIETGEPASAGQGAPINRAPEQLANRTSYLKKEQDGIKRKMEDSGLNSGKVAVVVVSETEPKDLPVGGFWLQPISSSDTADGVINRSDIASLFSGN